MAYLDEDILYNNVEEKYKSAKGKAREAYSDVLDTICEMPRADVLPKSEVDRLNAVMKEMDDQRAYTINMLGESLEKAKAEVARTFRKRMNEKMGKHTHLLGKEYVQRIMREVEKELIGEEDA